MTQHNAALVEETNAAIEQTEMQASELDRIVDIFRLSGTDAGLGTAPIVSAPTPNNDAGKGARGAIGALQDKVKEAAAAYLSKGSTAADPEWAEF